MSDLRKITLGFFGGALPLKVTEDELDRLRKALHDGGWHDVTTEDGVVTINLGVCVYLNVEKSERGVGFG